ncbi:MAG: hypothetical protein GY795_00175 [Desulfobacterales bacterium]|nr:hypothetical protein [Desulfobacterales bacterium]
MKILFLLIVVVLFPQACSGGSSYINVIPDFTQTYVKGLNSGNGKQYCAPVAVSNSIAWISGNENQQLKIISKLASKQYMNTSLKNGTGTTGVLRGVDKISEEFFGGYKKLEYQGWRKHPESYSTGVKLPDIKRIKSAISRKSAAWLNVGWYKYNKKKNEYRRIGGHWVTLVGSWENQLIIHDPAPRAGKKFSNEFVEYVRIQSGMLIGKKVGVSAKGYLSLGKGMHMKSGADFAILDGVVYFEI